MDNILQNSNINNYVNTAVDGVLKHFKNSLGGFLYFKTILNDSFKMFPFLSKITLNSNNTQKDNINKQAIKFININPKNLHASYTACKRNFLPYFLLLFPFINLLIIAWFERAMQGIFNFILYLLYYGISTINSLTIHGILKPCIAMFILFYNKLFYKLYSARFNSLKVIERNILISKLLLMVGIPLITSGLFYAIMLCSLLVGNFIYINLSLFQNIGVYK